MTDQEEKGRGNAAGDRQLPPHRQRALLDMARHSSDLIGLCDPSGRLEYLNPAGRRLIGIEDADIYPMQLSDYVAPEQRHLVFDQIVPAAERDGTWEGEMDLVNARTGERITVQRSTFACRDEVGELTGFISVMHDITERKRRLDELSERERELRGLAQALEQQIRQRTAALNLARERLADEGERREALQAAHAHSQKLEAIGQLTAGIAHDFNNLLGAVMGGLTIIDGRSDDPRIRQVVKMSLAAADRGAAMVRQLMDFARETEHDPCPVEIPLQLDELADFLRQSRRGHQRMTFDVEPELWRVLADRAHLQSALLNLANNGCDAMPDGGTLTIRARNVAVDEDGRPPELLGGEAVLIEVIDSGVGMDGATLQRITEPFFTTKERGRGTGLGLAMVKRFVIETQGALRIASQPGGGSTFGLYLPRAPDETPWRPPTAETREGDPHEQAYEDVLLVDDDPLLREILATGLTERGFAVTTAASGAEALALCATQRFDVLVTDLDMAGIGGVELDAALRARGTGLPCLFMSGSAAQGSAPHPVLRKPFGPDRLHRAIRQALALQGQHSIEAERLDRLERRLKSDCTRSLLTHWRDIKGIQNLPPFTTFEPDRCSEPHRLVVASVDLGKVPVAFQFTLIGDTLQAGAPGPVALGDLPVTGSDTPAARETAYRRCALTGQPSYEYARFDLGGAEVETFERLLLPFSTDGQIVDWIVGAVVMERTARIEQE